MGNLSNRIEAIATYKRLIAGVNGYTEHGVGKHWAKELAYAESMTDEEWADHLTERECDEQRAEEIERELTSGKPSYNFTDGQFYPT